MSFIRKIKFNWKYYGKPPWDTEISPPELINYISNHPPGRALDLGCGTGTNCITLAKSGWEVTGIDFVKRAISKAKEKSHQAGLNIDYLVDDVTHLDQIDTPFDLILDIGCFHNLTYQDKLSYLTHIQRLLRPEAIFLLYGLIVSSANPKNGLREDDISLLTTQLVLLADKRGMDRGRQSSWFTLTNMKKISS